MSESRPASIEHPEEKKGIELYYFPKSPGHVAVMIHPGADEKGKRCPGDYLSFGNNDANRKYIGGVAEDIKKYGVNPIRICLDLPNGRTIKNIEIIGFFAKTGNYDLVSNNCADQTLRLMQQLGFLEHVSKPILITTPMFITAQACMVALEQNEARKKEILTKQASLDNLQALIECEQKRLETKKSLATIASAVADWKSINIPKKIWLNIKEKYYIKKKNHKLQELERLQTVVTHARETENYQKLLDTLNKSLKTGGKTADALKVCIEHFPYDKLPCLEEKKAFLMDFQGGIKKIDALFHPLPKSIIPIQEKLKQLDDPNLSPADTQKLFFEVHQLLQKNAAGKENNQFIREFYKLWSAKAVDTVESPSSTKLVQKQIEEKDPVPVVIIRVPTK